MYLRQGQTAAELRRVYGVMTDTNGIIRVATKGGQAARMIVNGVDSGTWSSPLVHVGSGLYYIELTKEEIDACAEGSVLTWGYKDADVAEAIVDRAQVVAALPGDMLAVADQVKNNVVGIVTALGDDFRGSMIPMNDSPWRGWDNGINGIAFFGDGVCSLWLDPETSYPSEPFGASGSYAMLKNTVRNSTKVITLGGDANEIRKWDLASSKTVAAAALGMDFVLYPANRPGYYDIERDVAFLVYVHSSDYRWKMSRLDADLNVTHMLDLSSLCEQITGGRSMGGAMTSRVSADGSAVYVVITTDDGGGLLPQLQICVRLSAADLSYSGKFFNATAIDPDRGNCATLVEHAERLVMQSDGRFCRLFVLDKDTMELKKTVDLPNNLQEINTINPFTLNGRIYYFGTRYFNAGFLIVVDDNFNIGPVVDYTGTLGFVADYDFALSGVPNYGQYGQNIFVQDGAGITYLVALPMRDRRDAVGLIQGSIDSIRTAGGVITALVDIGAAVSSVLGPIVMEKGERKIVQVQVLEGGVPKDCTGMTAKLGIKERLTDTAFKIDPIDGVFSEDSKGVLSILTFTFEPDVTKDQTPFAGKYSAALYDGSGNKIPLTERGGVPFTLKEDLLDVL